MSLLEDVFLQDEANEAQELERVIEGGDYEERIPSDSDNNSEKEDEAEEDKRHVDPNSTKNKRVVKNPRFILNPARLTGPRGIQVIPEHFKDFKFKGKGHEKDDLDLVLKKLEHWAYRLYPKFKFEDCLKKIEVLGKKRPVMVHLQKIRSDQFVSDEIVVQKDSSDDEPAQQEDEFDKLLQQQIELARSTPAPGSVKKLMDSSHIENRSLSMPKATSSPSISDEQKERMLKNRKLAEERRLARLKANSSDVSKDVEENNESKAKKHAKINVIDSSDDENGIETVSVEMHSHKDSNQDRNEVGVNTDAFDNLHKDSDIEPIHTDSNVATNSGVNENLIDEENTNNTQEESAEKISADPEFVEGNINNGESNSSIATIANDNQDVVLENNIIQSTIQGLVENDNNLNLERDLINQDFEDGLARQTENESNVNRHNEETQNECDHLMDVDFSEDF